jgi:hypothetical protein
MTTTRRESSIEKTRIISQTRVRGEVEYNDGEFAEIQTVGIEGIEKDLLLETIQVHREDTTYSHEQFQHILPVGSWLDICTTIEVSTLESDTDGDESGQATGDRKTRLQ